MNLLNSRRILSGTGLVVALVILLSVNILSGATLKSLRFDLTQNQLYTLSPGTKSVLQKMQEPVKLRFYFSKKIAGDYPQLVAYAQRVEELLSEFKSHAGDKLTLEVLDPEPFSEVEDRAVQYGLQGYRVPSGDLLYFGLAGTNSTDQQEVVAFFQMEKEPFLEYDLTKLVYGLSNPKKLVVGVLSTLPIDGAMPNPMSRQMPEPWFILDQIRDLYEVRTVPPNAKEIAGEINLLMIVHPKNLGPETLYAIDQYVMRGGRALVFVDPHCEADQPPSDPNNPMAAMMAPRASDMPELFKAWGLQLEPGKIAGDRQSAIELPFDNRGRQDRAPHVQYLNLGAACMDAGSPLTAQLDLIRMGTAGILTKLDGATTRFEPLIQTSKESMAIGVQSIQFHADAKALLNDFVPSGAPLTLAAQVTGPAKSAFPDGRPKVPPAEGEPPPPEPQAPHLAEAKEPIQVIVVADADMLHDGFWVQVQNIAGMRLGIPNAKNGDFVINALDYLQGSTDLVALRGRGGSSRPFEVVEELKRAAEQNFRAEEQRLTSELDRAEREINELLSKKQGTGATILTPEVQSKIEGIRAQQVETRKRLRTVRHELNKDIENLGTKIKLVNIGLIPALVAVLAVGLSTYKANRRRS
jgi:gliding motility-associatede transport system auxiliary component